MTRAPAYPRDGLTWRDDAFWASTAADGLRIEATARAESPVLERFFAGYDGAFVLPDEREELDGFRECLALNQAWRRSFGRTHCELVVTFAADGGELLGGANFLATALEGPVDDPAVAIALNYIFAMPAARGRGLLRRMLAEVRVLAARSVDQDAALPSAIFIEQNDPLRLTLEECRRDSEHSGIDQIDRLAMWARVGARIVDFPYVQPALSAAKEAEDGLVYAVVDYPAESMPAWLLAAHLQSFFAISVLKGRDPSTDPVARAQLECLSDLKGAVPLLDMAPALRTLRAGVPSAGFTDLRALARM
jgi:GNAT superfamily N-acetyltransferase